VVAVLAVVAGFRVTAHALDRDGPTLTRLVYEQR
jgi:hypothetical protein